MKIKIYGHSDDCIEVEVARPDGTIARDELSAYGDDEPTVTTLRVATIGGSRAMWVHAIYDGCWSLAPALVSLDADDAPAFPPWSFTFAREHSYSLAMTIDTGDDVVTVEKVDP